MPDRQETIAIIGASIGQKVLYEKSKEMGLRVIGFAWDQGVISDDLYDRFYTISVKDHDSIVEVCKNEHVDGIITNASEFLAPIASMIAESLGLNCTRSDIIRKIQNKSWVRNMTNGIEGLSPVKCFIFDSCSYPQFPCVVKPSKGAAKKGVSFCKNRSEFEKAIEYAQGNEGDILIEEYVDGVEFSVESLSYKGNHQIVQITDKENSGPPHFVELGHYQPSQLGHEDKQRVKKAVKDILEKVNFKNGATHIEMKLDRETGNLYLIEINCRGGGDHISDTLVNLSTDCDYIRSIIEISLNRYKVKDYHDTGCSGVCYLSAQNRKILKYFDGETPDWIIRMERTNDVLSDSTSNYDRDGFFIYKSTKRPII